MRCGIEQFVGVAGQSATAFGRIGSGERGAAGLARSVEAIGAPRIQYPDFGFNQ